MIFQKRTRLKKPSTSVILTKTGRSIPEERDFKKEFERLLRALSRALDAYENRLFFFKSRETIEQIGVLKKELNEIEAAFQSDEQKYDALSERLGQFIAALEGSNATSYLLYSFKNHGVYRYLYDNPSVEGLLDHDLQDIVNEGYRLVALSAMVLVIYAILGTMGLPSVLMGLVNGGFAGSMMYFNGILGGYTNQHYAAKRSLPSLILGYDAGQYSVMASNQSMPQVLAWTMIESSERAFVSSVIFFFAALTLTFFTSVNMWVLPTMIMITPLISKIIDSVVSRPPIDELEKLNLRLNDYQVKCMRGMKLTQTEQLDWHLNIKRKRYAHRAFIATLFLGLAGFICSNVFSSQLPFVFGTLLFNTVLPFTFVLPIAVGVIAGGVYLYRKKHEQENNRYKLAFECKQTVLLPFASENTNQSTLNVTSQRGTAPVFSKDRRAEVRQETVPLSDDSQVLFQL
jgi:hypothetical protein